MARSPALPNKYLSSFDNNPVLDEVFKVTALPGWILPAKPPTFWLPLITFNWSAKQYWSCVPSTFPTKPPLLPSSLSKSVPVVDIVAPDWKPVTDEVFTTGMKLCNIGSEPTTFNLLPKFISPTFATPAEIISPAKPPLLFKAVTSFKSLALAKVTSPPFIWPT